MERREFFRVAGLTLASLSLLGLRAPEASAMTVSRTASLPERAGDAKSEKRYPMPAADGVSIDKDNDVIIARASGHVYAFALSCPHQNAAVRWVDKNTRFECTKHDSKYQADGVHTTGRATRNMDRFPIRRDGATIHVDTSKVFQSDKDSAGWNAASVPV